MTGWTLVTRHRGDVTEHPVDGETWIGRSRGCEVRVRDPLCSRRHLAIRPADGGLVLEHGHPPDQNPHGAWLTFRVYVNGEQVQVSRPLHAGDVITLTAEPDPALVIEVIGPRS